MTERTRPANSKFPALEGVEHRFVDLPGLRMHVAEAGRGEPVLVLQARASVMWDSEDESQIREYFDDRTHRPGFNG
jgi:hypothetical protein